MILKDIMGKNTLRRSIKVQLFRRPLLFFILFSIFSTSLFSQAVATETQRADEDETLITEEIIPSEEDENTEDAKVSPEQPEKAGDEPKEDQSDKGSAKDDEINLIYKGEHHLNIGVGMTVPVLMHFYNDPTIGDRGNGVVISSDFYEPPVGLSGFFDYKFFLGGGWALGAELGGTYLKSTNNSQTLIHLGAEATYMIRRWPVDIPISFGIGGHFNTFRREAPAKNIQSGGIFFKPEIGMTYNINEEWGIGFTTAWWIVPEIYLNEPLAKQSAFNHIWSFAVNVRYKFQ